jgi:hypothetical protein
MIHPDLPIDPEAPPGDSFCARALVQRVRWGAGLSQDAFAATFCLDADHLCEVEAGRAIPDAAMLAYLRVIEWSPEAVLDALSRPTHPF